MSMRIWTEDGYGFKLFNGNNWNEIIKFIISHNNGKYDLSKLDLKEIMESQDEWELENYLGEPVSWAIAQFINDAENIDYFKGYSSCGDTDQEEMIGIEPVYPWSMKEPFTKEDADKLLRMYGEELGIKAKPYYFEAIYFG